MININQVRQGWWLSIIAAALLVLFASVGQPGSASADGGFKLPWAAGASYRVNQTWNAGYHTGYNAYGYDFGMPAGANVLASLGGTVTKAAYDNRSGTCGGTLNEVHVTHADGSRTVYMHLRDVSVSMNQTIAQGQLLGHVGCTGFATGPHLHFQRDVNRQPARMYFDEYPGQQLPVGMFPVSQNGGGGPADEPDRSIGNGQTMSGVINPANDTDNIFFDGSSGQRVTIRMDRTSGGLDSYLDLYGPNGARVTFNDDGGGNYNSLINNFALPQNGRYRIAAHSWASASTGGYNVRLDITQPVNDEPDRWIGSGQTLSGCIDPASDIDWFVFTGSAGQVATIRMQKTSGSLDTFLRLYRPSGSVLTSNDDSEGTLNSLIGSVTLPESGNYWIQSTSWSARSTGCYNVSLSISGGGGGGGGTPTTVLIDDPELGGPAQYWLRYGIGNGNDMVATWNNGPCSYGSSVCPPNQDVNYAVWRPNLTGSSNYRLCAWIPQDHAYTRNARYVVSHANGTSVVAVNQQPLWGWADLGVFSFNAGTSGSVRLGDWTGEAFATTQIGFDAMKWVPNAGGC